MEEYKLWLTKAEEDLDTAQYLIQGTKISAAIFFLQQCVEKSLKAVYIFRHQNMLKTHDLVLLAKEVQLPANLTEICKELTQAYQITRYPDAILPNEAESEEVAVTYLETAQEVLRWTKKNFSKK